MPATALPGLLLLLALGLPALGETPDPSPGPSDILPDNETGVWTPAPPTHPQPTDSPQPSIAGNECQETCHPQNGVCDEDNICRCLAGWQGPQCDQCVTRPGCTNGYCLEPWQCFCKEGWTGYLCTSEDLPCNSSPCENNSTCSNVKDGRFSCACLPGFSGKHCQKKEGLCEIDGNPCQHGGTCVDFEGHEFYPTCLCAPGYSGDFCEILTVDCDPNPCENDGVCTDIGGDFRCRCPQGFVDKTCSRPVNNCATEPCQNGGTCLPHSPVSYECLCPDGYGGPTCGEKRLVMPPEEVTELLPYEDFMDPEPSPTPTPLPTGQPTGVPASPGTDEAGERRILKVAVSEPEQSPPAMSEGQAVCFTILGVLTSMLVAGALTLLFLHKCGGWMARLRAHPVAQRHHHRRKGNPLLHCGSREDLAVNIILPPEKIDMTTFRREGLEEEEAI
ncbi:protein delta homolog 1 [Erinaceus europaeus]|uniref:Protein delta homolog 1 n=1 Tax=Erinaceus europaeus TaxID=9365 RepID=A0ABM3WKE2_ERIEU|nr:protein delta homolog 1 [Erinaceus europaeus]